jgi:hypothetical protein
MKAFVSSIVILAAQAALAQPVVPTTYDLGCRDFTFYYSSIKADAADGQNIHFVLHTGMGKELGDLDPQFFNKKTSKTAELSFPLSSCYVKDATSKVLQCDAPSLNVELTATEQTFTDTIETHKTLKVLNARLKIDDVRIDSISIAYPHVLQLSLEGEEELVPKKDYRGFTVEKTFPLINDACTL